MLVIADLAPGYDGGAITIDRETFGSVMESLSPRVKVDAPDRIGTGRRSLACEFDVVSMDQLHPDGIVDGVPILSGLADARELLQRCLAREVEVDEVREDIVAAFSGTGLAESFRARRDTGHVDVGAPDSAGAERESAGAIDSLLDQVEVPEADTASPTATDLVEMMAGLLVPSSTPLDRSHLENMVREIDLRLSHQVAAIQEQPQYQSLQASWQGLKFLVDKLDFRGSTRLEVLPAGRAGVVERFFEHVFHDEYEGRSDVPLSFVLVDQAYGRSVPDLEAVRNMARLGESLNVPFVAAMDPSYWGVRQARLVSKLPDLIQKAQGSEYAKWNRFRSEPTSLWVTLTANRFLLRSAWADARVSPSRFSWSLNPDEESPVWGSAVWAMGAALGQSFSEAGITFPCVGPSSPGLQTDLPVLMRQEGSSEPHASTIEVEIADDRAFQLAQVGFAPLVSVLGSDQAYFNLVPSFHQPSRYEDREATQSSYLAATLPFRGFASAVANHLDRIGRALGAGMEPQVISEKVRASLLGMLAPLEDEQSTDSVEVEIEANPDEPALFDVTARLRPGFTIYGGPVDLIVGTSVPR
jgi:type VI secretion system protein ImpC